MQLPNLYEYATSAPENASFGFRTLSRDGVPCLVWQLPPGTDPREEGGEQGAGERVVRGAGDVEAVGLSRPSSHGVGVGRDGENAPVSEGGWRGEGRGRGEGRVVGRGGGKRWVYGVVLDLLQRDAERDQADWTRDFRASFSRCHVLAHSIHIFTVCKFTCVCMRMCVSFTRCKILTFEWRCT